MKLFCLSYWFFETRNVIIKWLLVIRKMDVVSLDFPHSVLPEILMDLVLADLVDGFQSAGIVRGDHLLVHSSLSSLGRVQGGADTVIEALVQAVGDTGTVMFPTLTGKPTDSCDHPPVFDARHSKCWTGTIPETARNRPDAIRSMHPTHSVAAFGRLANWITADHELVRTPCGYGSPYDKLAAIGGKVVLIGIDQSVNTCFHHAEELAEVPYVLLEEPVDVTMTDQNGSKIQMSETYLHKWGPERDYNRHEAAMIELGICEIQKVANADVRIIDASGQRIYLVNKLLEDPDANLDASEIER